MKLLIYSLFIINVNGFVLKMKSISQLSIDNALEKMRKTEFITKTPLQKNKRLSNKYDCNVYFKREDQQNVRSFKIRGAYNKIINTINSNDYDKQDIVTVSAGNHGQGVSLSCSSLGISHHVFLPKNTPLQKVNKIKYFGDKYITLHLEGNNFDESLSACMKYCETHKSIFVHPFDDDDVIIGQGTIASEIYEEINPDIIICPIGGGGLISGVGSYTKFVDNKCKIIGVEPYNADSMKRSLLAGRQIYVNDLNTFVDGASVKLVGTKTFKYSKNVVDDILTIDNNELSYNMIDIYQNDGIVLEPAGALSISALNNLDRNMLKNKNVVCILSGGNNDITRYPQIIENSLLYQDLKHYFLLSFNQIPGQLQNFINNIIGPNDDITRFEYLKKDNKETGSVLIGIELQNKEDIHNIINNMNKYNFNYVKINPSDLLYSYLI